MYSTVPPLHHPPGANFAATPVELMGTEQIARWVETLCKYLGWNEAEKYADKFRNNDVTGKVLGLLKDKHLETLGMSNENHRCLLLSKIRDLYPVNSYNTSMFESSCGSASNGWQISSGINNATKFSGSGSTNHSDSSLSSSKPAVQFLPNDTTHSYCADGSSTQGRSCSSPTGTPVSETSSSSRTPRFRKLILKLREDQMSQDENTIATRFAELNLPLKSIERSNGRYIIAFVSPEMTWEAYYNADYIDYKLEKKWPDTPSPQKPIEYENVSPCPLTIRKGKAFSQQRCGALEPNARVTINKVKGRRARIVEWKVVFEDQQVKEGWVTRGWVSVLTAKGSTLLRQVAELAEFGGNCKPYQDIHSYRFETE